MWRIALLDLRQRTLVEAVWTSYPYAQVIEIPKGVGMVEKGRLTTPEGYTFTIRTTSEDYRRMGGTYTISVDSLLIESIESLIEQVRRAG